MRAGTLRHRIEFWKPTESATNAYGEKAPDLAPDFTVWGEVNDLSGTELMRAKQVNSDITTAVTIRYREGITARHVIKHRGRTLHLVGPPRDAEGRRRELEVFCKEVA